MENQAEIEGLLDPSDVVDGFMKITAGISSSSGWYIRVRVEDIIDQTEAKPNPSYPQLGPLQVITLKRDGKFQARGNSTVLALEEFFSAIKSAKAKTVSPTATYKKLGA